MLLLVLVPSALAFYDYVSERHRPGRRRRPFGSWQAVAAAGIIGSAIVAGALWLPRSSGAGNTYPPTNPFHVFSESADAATGDVAASLEHHDGDPSGFHVLGKGLGRFDSRLVAFPSNGGICYSLTPQDRSNAGGGYCFVPGNRAASGSVAGLHFSALAFWSDIPEGNGGVQVFGVAYDDVSRIDVLVSGEWRPAELANNGFFLDVPAAARDDVTVVRATLADDSDLRAPNRGRERVGELGFHSPARPSASSGAEGPAASV